MNENVMEQEEEYQLDLQQLIGAVWKKKLLVLFAAVVCAVVVVLWTLLFVTPQYQSAVMFYVNNSAVSVGNVSLSISTSDLLSSRSLVDSYIIILETRESLLEVIDYAGSDRTYLELREMISAQDVDETEIFQVVVTSPDPGEAERIANAIAAVLPERISGIVEGTSAQVVDAAIVATKPSSPSYWNNLLVGFLLGCVLCVGGIVLQEILATTIRTEEDISRICPYPVLSVIPDMTAPGKGGYGYRYDRGTPKETISGTGRQADEPALIGGDMNFEAAEAYKLLRTKLQFSFAGDDCCRVIGVSSALSGEGKSLSSINLAYMLSQLDKKVLLIDCDMRRPTLAQKLGIRKAPGLSGFLTGQVNNGKLLQYCGIQGNETAFHVITAGQNPPNPMELLSSDRMAKILSRLRSEYDYILLDLPPVGEVSDAMAVAKQTDGILMVVRQNYCDRRALADAVGQLEFIHAKLVGFVFNCAAENRGKSGKEYTKRYYGNAAGSRLAKGGKK